MKLKRSMLYLYPVEKKNPFMAETRCVSRVADCNGMNVWRSFTETMCKIDA